jgi:plastocyanin
MDNPTNNKPALSPKAKMIMAVVGLAIIVVLVVVLTMPKKSGVVNEVTETPTGEEVSTEEGNGVATEENIGTSTVVKDRFREEVPTNIVVPDQNTQLTEAEKKEIALPTVVTPAAPGVEAQFRSFDIKAEGGVFTPSKIIARVGDTVHVNFTAVDKAYDIMFPSYNMKQTAKQGQTKVLEFQAVAEGSFLYYCDSCGGEKSTTKGNIIIAN